MEKFLLDSNIFGIDVERNLHSANNETLLLLYQPNLMFSRPYYNVLDTEARKYMQVYLEYLLGVSYNTKLELWECLNFLIHISPYHHKRIEVRNTAMQSYRKVSNIGWAQY